EVFAGRPLVGTASVVVEARASTKRTGSNSKSFTTMIATKSAAAATQSADLTTDLDDFDDGSGGT
ncbi:unnamed protein product, partial [Soboliphyme baturini]|uniref:Single-stranded DNA-binding protein n=1 Tax=Soboliphyme baturini TaxID=241478 RepID=A0A183IA00_9BILA